MESLTLQLNGDLLYASGVDFGTTYLFLYLEGAVDYNNPLDKFDTNYCNLAMVGLSGYAGTTVNLVVEAYSNSSEPCAVGTISYTVPKNILKSRNTEEANMIGWEPYEITASDGEEVTYAIYVGNDEIQSGLTGTSYNLTSEALYGYAGQNVMITVKVFRSAGVVCAEGNYSVTIPSVVIDVIETTEKATIQWRHVMGVTSYVIYLYENGTLNNTINKLEVTSEITEVMTYYLDEVDLSAYAGTDVTYVIRGYVSGRDGVYAESVAVSYYVEKSTEPDGGSGEGETGETGETGQTTLTAPGNVKLDGNTLSWDEVEGADEYIISLYNGKELGVSIGSKELSCNLANELLLTNYGDTGEHTVTIKAVKGSYDPDKQAYEVESSETYVGTYNIVDHSSD